MEQGERIKKWNMGAVVGTGFLGAALALQLAARNVPGFGQWYAVSVYPILTGTLGRITGWLPFSVSEVLLYALMAGYMVWIIYIILSAVLSRKRNCYFKTYIKNTYLAAAFLFFLYTIGCGVNYYRKPFSAYLEYKTDVYTREQLKELCKWLTEQVNASWTETGTKTSIQMQEAGADAMEGLGERYPALRGPYPKPKPLIVSRILSVQQLSGIYSPFTIEANYNNEMTAYNIPHTICHELSHLRGFMREEEANFIGFLACAASDDPEFCYSGYLSAWIYAGNALAAEDIDFYSECYRALRPEVREDLKENSQFWNRFESKVSEAAEAMNDHYLKANSQPEGVKSYGRVTDLLLAWYENGKEP